jgi:acyl-CoA synthetase (AMP-forming)/AMP-acid ligase II
MRRVGTTHPLAGEHPDAVSDSPLSHVPQVAGVGEHDAAGLPAEFEHGGLELLGADVRDLPGGGRAAGKADLLHLRVPHQRGPRARNLGLFPPGHVAGLLNLLRILLLGTPTVIMQAWDAALAASLIDRHAVTSSGGAPVQLSGLLDQQAKGTAILATLREFLTGAAPVPASLIRRADAAGITAYRSYGSSEHPTVTTGSVADSLDRRAATDGRLIAGNEIRIVDADGRDVPAGQDGEILTRGPELFTGYSDAALNTAAFLPGRWFRTGDVGRLDADGYLTVTDRLKDIIIRGGENISSKEVEDLLITHPAVADVAVIAAPDPVMGERVCAVVVTRPGSSFDVAQARAHFAAAGVARQKTPEVVMLMDELPRTPSGKVRKDALRAARRAATSD